MAIVFESLGLAADQPFGVRLSGAFGRGDRQRLLDLADRCLEREKTQLILDCADLDSLGGGGAGVLADLQRQLVATGGEAVFASVGQVIRRFLAGKFDGLPLRCFDDVDAALAGLGDDAGAAPAPAPAAGAPPVAGPVTTASRAESAAAADPPPSTAAGGDLDSLLGGVTMSDGAIDDRVRRAADLVTAAYVSLDDLIDAAAAGASPAVFGEALAVLLDSHDLAADTVFFGATAHGLESADGARRLPADGAIAAMAHRVQRPFTLLDVEEGRLDDHETMVLEQLCPDLIVPLLRGGRLLGLAMLGRGSDAREYGLSDVFALELLQRVLAAATANEPEIAGDDAGHREAKPPAAATPPDLSVALVALARGLHEAQDVPHFWQLLQSRLQPAATVASLVYLDPAGDGSVPHTAGVARRALDERADAVLQHPRLRSYLDHLERPVAVTNMPAAFAEVREALHGAGLTWLATLRGSGGATLGAVALGLDWLEPPADEGMAVHSIVEIAGEALHRMREQERRADLGLALVEQLVLGRAPGAAGAADDPVTEAVVAGVRMMAGELDLGSDQERDILLGVLLRDGGLDGAVVDDRSAEDLDPEHWEAYRGHPDRGADRVEALGAPAAVRDVIRHHHERFDGRGFPCGLAGRDIPLAARLAAVALCHALHLDRGADAALEAVRAEAGKALDPDLAAIFAQVAARHGRVPVGA